MLILTSLEHLLSVCLGKATPCFQLAGRAGCRRLFLTRNASDAGDLCLVPTVPSRAQEIAALGTRYTDLVFIRRKMV